MNSTAQNYTEAQNVYESYFDSKYELHLPIKDCIMIINHDQLLNMVKKHEKALVYVFKNGCTSDFCKPIYIYEKK